MAKQQSGTIEFNTIKTPNCGEFQVVLPDGTKVWLNAASEIKYPLQFASDARNIELNGEVYFELSHDKTKPFKVFTNGQVVEVLGTHFNVNSYSDEKIPKTTLLEGSVRVKSSHSNAVVVISPRQQAQVINNVADKINIVEADMDEVMAWKDNSFRFNNEDIQSIMRKISRWYDVSIENKGSTAVRAHILFDSISYSELKSEYNFLFKDYK